MAIQNWPATVNDIILHDGYGYADQGNTIVTQQTYGIQKQRRAFTAVSTFHTCRFRFERVTIVSGGLTEYQLFRQFVKDTIRNGTMEFYFKTPDVDTATRICRIKLAKDAPPFTIQQFYGNYVYINMIIEELPQ